MACIPASLMRSINGDEKIYKKVVPMILKIRESSEPDPKKGSYGIEKWQKHEHYSKYPNSDTELVEFLKELQK